MPYPIKEHPSGRPATVPTQCLPGCALSACGALLGIGVCARTAVEDPALKLVSAPPRLCRAIIMQRLAALREKEAAQRAAAAAARYNPLVLLQHPHALPARTCALAPNSLNSHPPPKPLPDKPAGAANSSRLTMHQLLVDDNPPKPWPVT